MLSMHKRLLHVTISVSAQTLYSDSLQGSYLLRGWSVLHRSHLEFLKRSGVSLKVLVNTLHTQTDTDNVFHLGKS